MPNLLNRFKHEELESNSAFHIRNQKEMRSKRGPEEEQKNRSNVAPLCEIFAPLCEIVSCIFYFIVIFTLFFPFLPFMCISVN